MDLTDFTISPKIDSAFQLLFKQAPVALSLLTGPTFVVQFANKKQLEVWQKDEAAVLGKPLLDILPEVKSQEFLNILTTVYHTGQLFEGKEMPVQLLRNGILETAWFDFTYQPYQNDTDSAAGILVTATEVTENVLLRKRWKESEARINLYEKVIVNINDSILITEAEPVDGPEGPKILYVNQAFTRMTGYSAEEVIGKTPRLLQGPKSDRAQLDKIYAALKAWQPVRVELTNYRKDGSEFEVEFEIVPMANEQGWFTHWVSVQRDVSSRKKSEALLSRSEARFRYIFNNTTTSIWVEDLSGVKKEIERLQAIGVTDFNAYINANPQSMNVFMNGMLWKDVNEQTLRLFGAKNKASFLASVPALFLPESLDFFPGQVQAIADNQAYHEAETVLRHLTNGRRIYVRIATNFPIGTDYSNVLVNVTDITTQKLAEEKLLQLSVQQEKTLAQLESLLSNAPLGFAFFDKQHRYTRINKTLADINGIAMEAHLGKTIEELLPVNAKTVVPVLDKVFKTGEAILNLEVTGETAKEPGVTRHWFTGFYPVKLGGRSAVEFVGAIVMEITESKKAEAALKESEDRFRSIANNAPAFIFLADVDISVSFLNQEWFNFSGMTEAESMGHGWATITHPDDIAGIKQHFNNAVQNLSAFEIEARHKAANGEYHWILWRGRPRLLPDGKLVGMMGTGIDITERKKNEEKIKQSEERYHNLIHSSPSAIAILHGPDLIITMGNDAIVEIWGKGKDVFGKPYFEVLPELVAQGYPAIFNEVYTTGKASSFVETPAHLSQNGEMVLNYYNFILYPQKEPNGVVNGIGIIANNVTEQAQQNKIIKQSESRFRVLAQTLPQLVWVTDAAGNIQYMSDKWKEYSGIGQFDAAAWASIIHPDDAARVNQTWLHSLATGIPVNYDVRLKNKKGSYQWFNVKGETVLDNEGKVVRWVGAATDIDDQKAFAQNLEAQVQQRTKELLRSNEELQQFAHVASHDLKEPVRKIKIFQNHLQTEYASLLPEKAKLYLSKIEKAVNRMYGMIDGVLLYSSIDTTEQHMEAVNLNEILQDIESDLEIVMLQTGATLHVQPLPVVQGSKILLHQLFYNLLNNALKFARKGVPSVVTISAAPRTAGTNEVCITVKDNGIGFGQEYAEKIFGTFARLNAKDEYEGTGLGLALCKRIVERHGGSIRAKGSKGEGASFIVSLFV